MLKKDALALFDGSVVKLAAALDSNHSTVSMWPDKLPLRTADRIRGACVRLGKAIPKHLRYS